MDDLAPQKVVLPEGSGSHWSNILNDKIAVSNKRDRGIIIFEKGLLLHRIYDPENAETIHLYLQQVGEEEYLIVIYQIYEGYRVPLPL
jgi:hypothetical protein